MHTGACALCCGCTCSGELTEEDVQQSFSSQSLLKPVNC